mgnify:CR=1 FL=1|tara:strand:+ start:4768 stop:5388 length:621 start_codon:yes stop_codon:yes gene_type:complete
MPKKKIEHIAIIPARKNSVGFPKKNRIFFSYTYNFLNKIKWFDKIYISTDDDWFKKYSRKRKYEFIKRSKKLSGHKISIKRVMEDAVKKKEINSKTIIWLIYIPLIPKSKKLFEKTKKIIESKNVKSICGFTKVKTHPFLSWYTKKNKLYQYCKNDIYRRQDLPTALTHNHVVCAFKRNELKKLNNELINSNTKPIIINSEIKEID